MSRPAELGLLHVPKHRPRRSQGGVPGLEAEPLQGKDSVAVLQEGLRCGHGEQVPLPLHQGALQGETLQPPRDEGLLWGKGKKVGPGLLLRQVSRLEPSRGHGQKGQGPAGLAGDAGGQQPLLSRFGGHEGPGGDQPDHPPLHQGLAVGFRHLIAQGHPTPRLHQPSQVSVHGVVGHPRHGDGLFGVPGGEGEVQEFRGLHGVVEEEFEEVPHAEEEEVPGVLSLPVEVLLQHGGQLDAFRKTFHPCSLRPETPVAAPPPPPCPPVASAPCGRRPPPGGPAGRCGW